MSDSPSQAGESVRPLPDGSNGRDRKSGKFLPGNKLGHGSPLAVMASKLRAAMLKAVKAGDVKAIIKAMVAKARGGNVQAAKLVLSYSLGEPIPCDIAEKIFELEAVLAKVTENEYSRQT